MPATAELYDEKGDLEIAYGTTRRNTVLWDAFGKAFGVGGFGNLPGDMDVWERGQTRPLASSPSGDHLVLQIAVRATSNTCRKDQKSDGTSGWLNQRIFRCEPSRPIQTPCNEFKRPCSRFTCSCSVEHAWGPDGVTFLSAVCAPRMRVDNKVPACSANFPSVISLPRDQQCVLP